MKVNTGNTLSEIAIPQQYKGEVRTLYQSYNFMIKRIKELINEVYIADIKKKEAELNALQAQINPHFMYNTLDSINWMAIAVGAKNIQKMTQSLASMLRYSLNNGENQVEVYREIDQVRAYLDILQFRYPEQFDVSFDISEDILYCRIIKLIIQPLVENAIIHGFEGLNYRGNLIIRGYLENMNIIIEVRNSGNKMDLEKIQSILYPKTKERPKSYGIRNVNERLINAYGQSYHLQFIIEDEFSVAKITIPLEEDTTN